ncbi:MAG TPA: prolipoprotein diacylglyceryl transferase [Allosphingosinicella sp.]|nr:prolipoprotein diacylglyceryl transferase [Allosphingosinicella sp.]
MIDALLTVVATASDAIRFEDLGLTENSKIALDLGFFQLRWYSLAYLFGIVIGWWYLLKLLREPGAPMAKRHADDMVFYATLGIILGGRLGYVLFYRPGFYLENPLEILQLWDGGMSFHGGVIGVSLGILWMARKHNLDWLRIHDYVACCIPFGLFLGRLANFVNAELWGRQTDLPWGIIFPNAGGVPRHPSQLYEAALEGIFLFLVLWVLFWKTRARWQPGKLVGTFILVYGISRFLVELVRQPDAGLENLSWGLSMGQTLSLPMILGGLYLILTAPSRAQRVAPDPSREATG